MMILACTTCATLHEGAEGVVETTCGCGGKIKAQEVTQWLDALAARSAREIGVIVRENRTLRAALNALRPKVEKYCPSGLKIIDGAMRQVDDAYRDALVADAARAVEEIDADELEQYAAKTGGA